MVSNREPYVHTFQGEEIHCEPPPSGMAIALDPVMKVSGGIWVAHGAGDADREVVDSSDHVKVPPDNPHYTLRRVWLTKEEEEGYYYGFSNEALWPLSHIAYSRPIFNEAQWQIYKRVNEKFAQVILEELNGDTGFVFIQDYHFALLPRILKEIRPDIMVAQFWHIPWPNPEVFKVCPWAEEILDGLLGNDLLCFHILYHCQNFLEAVDSMIEAKIDREKSSVIRGGRETFVKPFPISVDFEEINTLGQASDLDEKVKKIRRELGLKDRLIGIGIDRVDYIKGIPDRLRAVDLFFEKYPEYLGKFTFLQLGPLSRIHIQKYKEYNDEINHIMVETNLKYGFKDWKPIVLRKAYFNLKEEMVYYRLANVCVVSSLHDGMNLVAKEFVAARSDGDGVLILSQFTGSARELTDAVLVNPYATDDFAHALKTALEMPAEERKTRMRKMREVVQENNIYKWAGKIISEFKKVEPRQPASSRPV
ncbi:MAG: trehalose-6-phosphate synthase [Chlamydiae bacterium]|nr:trehalose-6-phosphate synthase [Chlamydiota bacterium]MBI3266998.1 trehalose-6-phosphate synthase [Chlamydiota bacterium]